MILKTLILAASAALALAATPAAAADFTGPRVGANLGIAGDDVLSTDVKTYGVNGGFDFAVGDAIVGGTLEYQDSFRNNTPRELSASARIGTKLASNLLGYGTVGYTRLGTAGADAEGLRLGVGAELALTNHVALVVEQRHTEYGAGANAEQTVAGLNIRF
jgi:outer membrane immunogenic protein